MITTYEVWIEGNGDIYRGFSNEYVSTHLDKAIADKVAFDNRGYVWG